MQECFCDNLIGMSIFGENGGCCVGLMEPGGGWFDARSGVATAWVQYRSGLLRLYVYLGAMAEPSGLSLLASFLRSDEKVARRFQQRTVRKDDLALIVEMHHVPNTVSCRQVAHGT